MLSRIGLERFCLVLVAVMTAEVGYLWGLSRAPVEHKVVVLDPVSQAASDVPATLVALGPQGPLKPEAEPAETAGPPAAILPRRHVRPGKSEPAPAPRPNAAWDCARSDDPLCGLPSR